MRSGYGEWEGQTLPRNSGMTSPLWHQIQYDKRMPLQEPPGGELMIEVQTRMAPSHRESSPGSTEGGTMVVVSHADPLRSVIARYCLGMSLDLYSSL